MLSLIDFQPHVWLDIRPLADNKTGYEPRGETERAAQRGHGAGPCQWRAVFGRERSLGIISCCRLAGRVDVRAVFKCPLEPFEVGLSVVRGEACDLPHGRVGRRKFDFGLQEALAGGRGVDMTLLADGARAESQ